MRMEFSLSGVDRARPGVRRRRNSGSYGRGGVGFHRRGMQVTKMQAATQEAVIAIKETGDG
jgi:hypothetical protein